MTSVTIQTPAQVAEPRGARAAVVVVLALREALSTLRQGLARHRAYRSRVAEAGRMRALAHRVGRRDHRMAAEMLSAADRHELG